MKRPEHTNAFLQRISTFPLFWLSLSRGKRLLIVLFSYCLGALGLWFFFPLIHNGVSMYLPIVSAGWLFRYRGMLISLVLNGVIFQVAYIFLLRGMLPEQAFMEGAIIGFTTSLGLGLVICWLRIAVDQVNNARQQMLATEQERLQAIQAEHQVTLAYEQQCKINELKDQFLMNVSHELRTPLTVLGGSLELLIEYHERLEPIKRTHLLKNALASQEELADLVNRVLDATTVVSEIPQAQCKAVNIYQIIHEVLRHLSPEDVQDYTFSLQVPRHVMVWADPLFVRQVLLNLLSNIFKYVPTQTEIHIETLQTDPTFPVYLSIQDEGPGIPSEELPLLFEKFVRLKRNITSSTHGTGLGLYICKRLVEAMEGHIWVESSGRMGEGSRFYIALPAFSPLDSPQSENSQRPEWIIANS